MASFGQPFLPVVAVSSEGPARVIEAQRAQAERFSLALITGRDGRVEPVFLSAPRHWPGRPALGSVTVFDGSAVVPAIKLVRQMALGDGGSTMVVADFFSAAVGCAPWAPRHRAPQPIAAHTNYCSIASKKLTSLGPCSAACHLIRPNLQGKWSRHAAARAKPYFVGHERTQKCSRR